MHADLDRARSALFAIDPGADRDTWRRAGVAAIAAGLSVDDLVEWSSAAANFVNEKDVRSAFRGVTPEGDIKPATLFKMARAAGWRDAGGDNGTRKSSRPSSSARKPQGASARPRAVPSAAAIWARCLPADEGHGYIAAKQGVATGLRVVPEGDPLRIAGESMAGRLVVPMLPLEGGEPVSLQFIAAPGGGKKLNLPGAPVAGVFVVGDLQPGGTVFLCEGVGTAWAAWKATGQAAVCCFGWGRVDGVAKELRRRDPAARIVICPDKGKEDQAQAIAREVAGLIAPMPAEWPANADLNDLALRDGHDALEVLLAKAQEPPITCRLDYVSAADVADAFNPTDELVEGLLTVGGASILYGDSNTGKSFLAVALAFAVARGDAFFGRRTEAGLCIYLAAESPASVIARVTALQRFHGVTAPDLVIVKSPIDLYGADDDADAIVTLVHQIERKTGRKVRLIVGDTLARMSAGANENAGQDMGAVVGRVDRIRLQTGSHFLMVHHSGKQQAAGARGWSGLRAAVDTEIEITDTPQGRCLEVTKARDLPTRGDRLGFRLEVIELGTTKWGKPATTCVAVPADAPPKQTTGKRMGEVEGAVVEFLAGKRGGVRKAAVVQHFEGRYLKSSIYRALKTLVAAHAAHEAAGLVALAEAAR